MSPLLEKHWEERQFEAQITEHEALLYKVLYCSL